MSQEHILHLLGTAQSSGTGIARIVGAIANGLNPERFKLHAWFLQEGGPLVAALQKQGVEVRVLAGSHGVQGFPGLARLWTQLRERKFAIVHQHYGGRAIRWAARHSQGSVIVLHLHGRIVEKEQSEMIEVNARTADIVIATSAAVARRVRACPVRVVYPGVPVNGCPGLKSQGPQRNQGVVGTAARLVSLKGIDHLIRAISLLRTQVPNVRLEVAGSGPEASGLREEALKLGLGDSVTFLGWQPELAPLFARWDVFVLPSLEEGFGITLVEAMAAALPVIGTNVGGIPEIVEHGKTGFLVPPADPAALADSLALLLANPEKRTQFGLAGWARAREKFSQESMVSAVEDVYERLLARQSFRTSHPASRAV